MNKNIIISLIATSLIGCGGENDDQGLLTPTSHLSAQPQAITLIQGQQQTVNIESLVSSNSDLVLNSAIDNNGLGSITQQTPHSFDYLAQTQGTTTISYEVQNADLTAQSQILVAINPPAIEQPDNSPPLAQNINLDVLNNQNTTIDLKRFVSDANNDPLTITNLISPSGRFSLAPDGFTLNFKPNGFVGVDQAMYSVEDSNNSFAIGYVVVTTKDANPSKPNQQPIAQDYQTSMDIATTSTLTINLDSLKLISDPDGDPLHVTQLFDTNNRAQLLPNNVIQYDHKNFTGVDQFTYVVSDSKGGYAAGTATIIVNDSTPANQLPIALRKDVIMGLFENTISFSIADVVSDPDNDELKIIALLGGAGQASISPNNPLSIQYTKASGYDTDSVGYVISDGKGGYALNQVEIIIPNPNPT